MIEVVTGSRLHFGLMELCPGQPGCYAGFGLMVDQPQLTLRLTGRTTHEAGVRIQAGAEFRQRIWDVVQRRVRYAPGACLPGQIELLDAPPLHAGLGVGTQTACATAAALEVYQQHQPGPESPAVQGSVQQVSGIVDARQLARLSGRGLRSAIGLQGFLSGGLLLDAGLPEGEPQSGTNVRPVQVRCTSLPEEWRIVMLMPRVQHGICGQREARLLAEVARRPNPHREQMQAAAEEAVQLIRSCVSPPSQTTFESFASALERYMEWAAGMFVPLQNGMYNGAEVTAAVQHAQSVGLRGIGQSSWGPTVFGFAPSAQLALIARDALLSHYTPAQCWIARAYPPAAGQVTAATPHAAHLGTQPPP